jgi:hypothetical protein
LKTIYSVEDCYILWEVIAISRHNEHLANKYYKDKAK